MINEYFKDRKNQYFGFIGLIVGAIIDTISSYVSALFLVLFLLFGVYVYYLYAYKKDKFEDIKKYSKENPEKGFFAAFFIFGLMFGGSLLWLGLLGTLGYLTYRILTNKR